eukprot:9468078-Pyramimonas_sp.AAC.1
MARCHGQHPAAWPRGWETPSVLTASRSGLLGREPGAAVRGCRARNPWDRACGDRASKARPRGH